MLASAGAAPPDLQQLIGRAEAGDAAAQVELARRYDSGFAAPRDGVAARRWYLAAANQGNADAQNSMGSVLQAEKRYGEALPWYELAAAQNDALALNNLAYLYDLGLGVPQDRHKAFDLYTRSADGGWPEAMLNLAVMHGAGQVGEKDELSACIWATRAQRYAGSTRNKVSANANAIMRHLQHTLDAEALKQCQHRADAWSPHSASAPQPK